MLTPTEISEPGFYWYYRGNGSPPVVVEIAPAEAPEPQLEVRFQGREDWDTLADLTGEFEGPLKPSRS